METGMNTLQILDKLNKIYNITLNCATALPNIKQHIWDDRG